MTQPGEFTAANFNIQHASDGVYDHPGDPDKLAEAIVALNCDLIGLQEVDKGLRRSRFVNLAQYAAEAAGMKCLFAPSGTFRGRGEVGNAWLIRGEIHDEEIIDLRGDRHTTKIRGRELTLPVRMPRNVHIARFGLAAGELSAGNIHISGLHPQMLTWAAHILTIRSGPHMLMGDFNMRWHKVQNYLEPCGLKVVPAPGVNSNHIAVKGLEVLDVRKIPTPTLSDQDPVVGRYAVTALD